MHFGQGVTRCPSFFVRGNKPNWFENKKRLLIDFLDLRRNNHNELSTHPILLLRRRRRRRRRSPKRPSPLPQLLRRRTRRRCFRLRLQTLVRPPKWRLLLLSPLRLRRFRWSNKSSPTIFLFLLLIFLLLLVVRQNLDRNSNWYYVFDLLWLIVGFGAAGVSEQLRGRTGLGDGRRQWTPVAAWA